MPDSIESAVTRHQIQLQRLAGGNYRKIIPVLKKMSKDLHTMILEAVDPEQVKTLQIAEVQARSLVKSSVSGMEDILEPEFNDFAVYEANFTRTIYSAAVNVELSGVTAEAVLAAVSNKKMNLFDASGRVQSASINQAVKSFSATAQKDVLQTSRGGFISGQTSRQMANDVRRMVNTRTQRQAEALVRTSTNHIGSIARSTFFKENSNVIEKEKYVATLDRRTSLICIHNDGKLFDIGKGPIPPLHWNCRSVRVAEVKEQFKIPGLAETRSSITGPVSDKITYGGFLKKQNKEFQNDVLGPKRAELFRSGKISIDKFTDHGRVLTLDELKRIEK